MTCSAVSPPAPRLAVDAKAKALKAAGEPVIGYGAGEPDFPTPAHIVEAAAKACYDPSNYKYTPTAGLAELREAIVAKTMRDSGLDIDAEPGAGDQRRQARGGDRLHDACWTRATRCSIPAPYWTTYPEAVYLDRRHARARADQRGERFSRHGRRARTRAHARRPSC